MTLKEVRDYMKGLERKVLKPEDSNLRIRYVFFPKEVNRFRMIEYYGKFYMNNTMERSLYGCIYFNVPYIHKHINNSFHSIESKKKFLTKIFMHEYRHYIQNRDIEELRKYILYSKIEKWLEDDADNYSKTYIKDGIELPVYELKKKINEFYRYMPNCVKIRNWTFNRVETI
jgi:hypothetical protein